MGITSENVAEKYGITRQRQDEFANRSQAKATAARDQGHLSYEIVPTTVQWTDTKGDGSTKERTITADEGIRSQTTMESLGKLKPAFSETGTSTAGNSSQISDGASALTLCRRDVAERLGLKPIGRFIGTAVAGVPPNIMGIGPAFALPALLKKHDITVDDVDLFELNEGQLVPCLLMISILNSFFFSTAFASQALATMDVCKVPEEKVNPKGGAIAIG